MPYPRGMRTYTSEAFRVEAFDFAAPESVDILGTYETFPEACRARDHFAARFTYDMVRVADPVTITYPAHVNPFGDYDA